jgi:hypothetical protein
MGCQMMRGRAEAGRKRRSRRLLDTTNSELNAIAAAAISGLRNPTAAEVDGAALLPLLRLLNAVFHTPAGYMSALTWV